MRATHRTILAAVGSLVLVTAACDAGTDGMTPSPTNQPPPTTPDATPSPGSPTPTDDGSPSPVPDEERAYALSFSAEATGVVEIDVATGEIVREVTDAVGQGAASLDLVPGDDALVFSRTVSGARSEIVRVPTGGGDPEVIDRGYAVDVTDDGSRTAIARRGTGGGGDETIELEVTEDGATLGSWTTRSTSELPVEPEHLVFSDDGEQLAFSVRFEDGTGVYVLDLTSAPTEGELTEAARQVEPREDDGWMSFRPFWLGDGTFGLVQGFGDLTGFDRYEAATVDLEANEVTGTLFEVPRAVGEIDRGADDDRLVFTLRHLEHGGDDGAQPPVVMSWDGDELHQVATDLTSPTW